MGETRIGISSWGDPSLIKSGFYPSEVRSSAERLRYYSSRFSLAESDLSYHVIPGAGILRGWIEATPKDFVFDIKVFSLFSGHPTPLASIPRDLRDEAKSGLRRGHHLYINHLSGPILDKLWERFAASISPLNNSGKLGLLMFQYPPWFHPNPENIGYLTECRQRLRSFKMAVEFRTPDWFDAEHLEGTLGLLRSLDICLVCVDEPQGLKSSIPPLAEATSSSGVVRFHGRNAQAWEQNENGVGQKYDYLYRTEELKAWLPKINRLQNTTSELHLIFKNKHADHPVVNALQMKELLGL